MIRGIKGVKDIPPSQMPKWNVVEKSAHRLAQSYGFKEIRVRMKDSTAKIELPYDQIEEFVLNSERTKIVKKFLSLGFTSVSIDLEGLVSGKMNRGESF